MNPRVLDVDQRRRVRYCSWDYALRLSGKGRGVFLPGCEDLGHQRFGGLFCSEQRATREEVVETVALAVYMGGGPATVYGGDALRAYDRT